MPNQKFSELVSDRLTLRRFQVSDVPAFVTYRSDPQVASYQSWDSPYLAADGERMIADLLGQHPDTAGQSFQLTGH